MTHVTTPALTVGSVTIREHGGLYSLNDLHRASGGAAKHQPALFVRLETTQALIQELCSTDSQIKHDAGIPASKSLAVVRGRGKAQGTYACRELVIAYAAWISAAFHLKVIRVFLDTVAQPQPQVPPSTYRIEQAYALAQQTATLIADEVYRAALAGECLNYDRCLLLISGNGSKVTPVDPRAHIFTPEQVMHSIKRGELLHVFSEIELTQLAQTVMERIKIRLGKPTTPARQIARQSTSAVALNA